MKASLFSVCDFGLALEAVASVWIMSIRMGFFSASVGQEASFRAVFALSEAQCSQFVPTPSPQVCLERGWDVWWALTSAEFEAVPITESLWL